ncbi:NADP-dependent 3-hydroxy acid dehydrogenase YdfG [Ruegeria halocynthiae]|uniref:NADP-dependent 3-hydroxy acid dehydrogenase YdfG n=1 Tax=Ruegeria halocynthiae TaxID=985054 RepID=A0A1H2SSE6_9RHOB|nr:SDR family NAD(P)-dependent oxidoreductase [Ruegeria halocynthiae]SDW34556.1 NADP-dependent 3-hydroxy acid dehydrogenase YdfG [Ruegeria halocynthiae]
MTDQTKIALVTGASRGLGAALAEALSPDYHIVAVARTQGGLEELDDRIQAKGGSATLAPMDIADPNAMATLCRGIHDRWGKVDLWLHTAIHTSALTPVHFADPKEWTKAININATATSVLIPYIAPLLGEAGHAVFFEDPKAGEKFYGIYGATKAAQMALARSWAIETERTGPRVSIVEPAPMPTAVRARFHPGEDRDALASTADEASRILAQL